MQCRCNSGSGRAMGSSTDAEGAHAAVEVAGPWVAVHDAVVQRMLGSKPSISTRTDAR